MRFATCSKARRAQDGRSHMRISGAALGIPTRGPWKPVLDMISLEETAVNRPDITYVVVKASTGYPGQIGFKAANPPSDEQKALSDSVQRTVFDFYRP